MLIVFAGLPASGKSAVAQALQRRVNGVLLDKDEIRSCLFAGYVDYQRQQDDVCVSVMYEVARYHLKQRADVPVILDGRTYSRRYQVTAVEAAAAQMEVPVYFIECVCSADSARHRLEADQGKHLAEDRDYSLYVRSRDSAEPLEMPRLVLDTDENSIEVCVQLAATYIKSQSQ